MTPPTELQPCPFCGGEATMMERNDLEWYANPDKTVGCSECGFLRLPWQKGEKWESGKGTFSLEPDCTNAAIAAWNTRAPGKVEGKWRVEDDGGLYYVNNTVTLGNIWVENQRTAEAYRDALNRADALLKGGKP